MAPHPATATGNRVLLLVAVWVLAALDGAARGQEPPVEPIPSSTAPTPPEAAIPNAPEPRPPATNRPGGMGGPGGGGMGGPGGGMGGPGYTATWYPSRPVIDGKGFGGLPSSVGLVRQQLNAGVPIWADPPNMLMLNATVGHTLFQTDAVLPNTRRPFPEQLWNVSLGLMYMRQLEDGWSVGGMVGFGSSSDKPFHSLREMNVTGMAFLGMPAFGGRDSWRFSLIYSPVGALNFPIPGVAYQWNPNDRLSVGIGLPLSVNWRPTDDWTLSAMYIPLTNVNARVTRRLTDEVSLYAAYEWLNESYFLADRLNAADRFIGLEQRVRGGVAYDIGAHLSADVSGGYAFNRRYGEGSNVGGAQTDVVNIRGGAFLSASLRLRF